MSKSVENGLIKIRTLISTYKTFLRNKKKVFVVSDFTSINRKQFSEKYLNTLRKLNLIVQVPAVYYIGKKYRIRREVKGYKLK